jgi:hypothetical protein
MLPTFKVWKTQPWAIMSPGPSPRRYSNNLAGTKDRAGLSQRRQNGISSTRAFRLLK